MKKNSWSYSVLALTLGIIINLAIFFATSWALTIFWNKLVVNAFSTMPTIEISQTAVLLICAYVVKQIIKWW